MRRFAIFLLSAALMLLAIMPASAQDGTIVDVAAGNEDFSTLVAAVQAANLVETLSSEGPFTVFAPTDEAFAAALDALGITAEDLLSNTDLLTQILVYHVVSGELMAADVVGAIEASGGRAKVPTLMMASEMSAALLDVTVGEAGPVINGNVNVVATDVEASNGVIHVIDGVLLPLSVEAQLLDGPEVVIAPDDPIRLGFGAALTGEGLSAFGIDINRGVELALEDRPALAFGEAVFPVELDVQDDLCNPEGGQTVANRFVADNSIVAVIGPMCSSGASAAAPIFDAAGYSNVSASATAGSLTKSGFTSFNRTVPTDDSQGLAAADIMYNVLGARNVAFIDDGSTYGAGLVDVVSATFEALGGTVAIRDAVTVGEVDFRALLEDVAAAEPDLIYFAGFNAEAARLVEQRLDVGLEDVPFMGADGIFGPELVDLAGDASEGVYATRPIPASSEELDTFAQRYVDTYGEEPPSAFNTNAYDATNLILNAIQEVGYLDADGNLVIDREALNKAIRRAAFAGLTGSINCSLDGECSSAEIGFYQVQDGAYTQID